MRSRSHQTISEHLWGSGAMIKIGSARIKHSHIDHNEGRMVANALNGDEWGREAMTYTSVQYRQSGRDIPLWVDQGVLKRFCEVAVLLSSLAF
jgi:hypothetical protein